jgi:hypothetical protein
MPISKSLYEQVRQRAKCRCEYCHYPEFLSTSPLSVEHLWPRSLGGTDDFINLALACRRCNERRYNFITGMDPESGCEHPLFNPRLYDWPDHFIWSTDGIQILGSTAIGRATCHRLDLNDERRSPPFIQLSRQQWVNARLHPPADDPQQR